MFPQQVSPRPPVQVDQHHPSPFSAASLPPISHIHPRPPELLFQNTFETVYDSTPSEKSPDLASNFNKAQQNTGRHSPIALQSVLPRNSADLPVFPPGSPFFALLWPLTTAITTRLSTTRPRPFIANFTGTGGFWLIDASTPELRADFLTILYCGRDWNARTCVPRLSLHPPDRAHDLAFSPRRQQPATVNRLRENFEHCMVNSMASVRE
ncbi:hypothetical protein GCG54_00005955 [Colletotrichum gloeosporioides]|uniref:Uncharacterized protein n=1 Tax=Colletotrichum gloeosporioides TaxID=474922 RepID=A0A8H4FMB7_COLGL|nr:uncharacterized protein GCG54_00005955 [Colletotrichum gloeosporioides]KAF3806194.1 hypothetical protein GCG54_00005955 [Colletotrichum gloeosporioides]